MARRMNMAAMGEYPAKEPKAAIEWVRNPLVQEDLAEAAE
jgi:hypothetical protein